MRRMNALSTLVLLLASGCASTPTSHFYTLNAAKTPTAAASKVSVAVGPVSVPAQVDRPQFVVSSGRNQVQIDEFNRWAAPLQDSITRVVAENLVAMLGSPHVTLSSQTLSANTGYRVAIEVQGFDSTPGESTSLDAVWTVRRMQDGKSESGRATLRESVEEKGYDALAAAHSRAIAKMSQDIADAIRGIERTPIEKPNAESGR
jgi:uncharacterized lipoprotein YmbA